MAVALREFTVTTTAAQGIPAEVNLKDGGYVIAWADAAAGNAIRAQRFGADGNAVGSQTTLAAGTGGSFPKLAALADGGFVLAYESSTPSAGPTGMQSTLVRFDASGQAGFTQQVPVQRLEPLQVVGLPNGGYAWLYSGSTGMQLDVYDNSNHLAGSQALPGAGNTVDPAVFASADGVLHVVTTDSQANYSGTGAHIYEQRFDSSGSALAAPALRITSPTSAFDLAASPTADGKYVITYARWVVGNEPRTPGVTYTTAMVVAAQLFDATGAPVGPEAVPDLEQGVAPGSCPTSQPGVQVACPTPLQGSPKVLPLQAGGYVLSWASLNRPGLQGMRFDSQGVAASSLMRLTTEGPPQYGGFVATGTPSSIPVIAWISANAGGNGLRVMAKQWSSDGPR